MRSPAVVLVAVCLACLLPAQAELSRDVPQTSTATRSSTLSGKALATGPVHMRPAANEYEQSIMEQHEGSGPALSADEGLVQDRLAFSNGFFLGGGTYYGKKDVGLVPGPRKDIEIGELAFSPPDYGWPEFQSQNQGVVPFVGGGFNTHFSARGQWDIKLLAGAAFFGPVKPGGRTNDIPFSSVPQADRAARRGDLSAMIQVGLSYRF